MTPGSESGFDHIFWLWVAFVCLVTYNVVAVHLMVKMFSGLLRWAHAVTEHIQGRDPLKPPPPGAL